MPSKMGKYHIKIWQCCDSLSSYPTQKGEGYLGNEFTSQRGERKKQRRASLHGEGVVHCTKICSINLQVMRVIPSTLRRLELPCV